MKKALSRKQEQIKEVGGKLHFLMKIDKEGWYAKCKEFPAIVAGGLNKNPSQEEVFRTIFDSVETAFDVPITPIKEVAEEYQNLFKINLEQEFSLPNYLWQ